MNVPVCCCRSQYLGRGLLVHQTEDFLG